MKCDLGQWDHKLRRHLAVFPEPRVHCSGFISFPLDTGIVHRISLPCSTRPSLSTLSHMSQKTWPILPQYTLTALPPIPLTLLPNTFSWFKHAISVSHTKLNLPLSNRTLFRGARFAIEVLKSSRKRVKHSILYVMRFFLLHLNNGRQKRDEKIMLNIVPANKLIVFV